MVVRALHGVLHCLRRAVLTGEGAGPTDGELLELYRTGHEEPAFEALVRRHAAMVWGVCRRILGNVHDAEDAFQAVFLVLVRRAGSIRPAHMVGNWLHGVAYRTAMNAKANRSRRKSYEARCRPERMVKSAPTLDSLLDQELDQLSANYRAVLVLCDLEGKTRKEAARQLGCPEGTVAGRLARARVLLAKRMRRHGLTVSGAALALELAQSAASAMVPAALVIGTLKLSTVFALGTSVGGLPPNVLTLTKGVLKAMLIDKLKVAFVLAVVVLAGLVGTATNLPMRSVAAAEPDAAAAQSPRAPSPSAQPREPEAGDPKKPRSDSDPALQGIWSLQRVLRDGKAHTPNGAVTLVVTNNYMIWQEPSNERAIAYKVNTAKSPRHIDLTLLEPGRQQGDRVLGVYAILADTLVIHESDGMRPRDTNFNGTMGSTVCIYRRVGDISTAIPRLATLPYRPDANGAWANKLFEAKGEISIDFGKVARGTQVPIAFRLKNIYAVPLEITHFRYSCGCVGIAQPVKRLQPKEEDRIEGWVDTRRFVGQKTITIYVGVRAGDYASTATLRVSGESVDCEPSNVRKESRRGKIIRVDDKSQLVEIDLGSDDGVKRKQTLEVFRLQPRAEYLGKLRIVEVEANRAVGRVVTPSVRPIAVGDEVGDAIFRTRSATLLSSP
jgi:RNA polymerase sigma factor (sigma-70 family)